MTSRPADYVTLQGQVVNYIWDQATRRLGSTFTLPRTALISRSHTNDVPLRRGETVSIPVISGLSRCADLLQMAGASLLAGWFGYGMVAPLRYGECAVVSFMAVAAAYWACERQNAYSLAALRSPLSQAAKVALAALGRRRHDHGGAAAAPRRGDERPGRRTGRRVERHGWRKHAPAPLRPRMVVAGQRPPRPSRHQDRPRRRQ